MINVFSKILNIFKSYRELKKIITKLNDIKLLNGKILAEIKKENNYLNPNENEFKCFSQFGEDGIIQYLINNINLSNKKFIEFGVENYEEANTRFLLENDNWSGLIIDSSENNINFIKKQDYYWKHEIRAVKSFIKVENINQVIKDNKFEGKIGILSIDIDGNDYWILKEIEVVTPDILIVEYNSLFGAKKSVTIKYKENYNRNNQKGVQKLIYGCSLAALVNLCLQKGYSLVCTNSNGNNAFFVRNDLLNDKIKKIKVEDAFHQNTFKELFDDEKNPISLDSFEKVLKSDLIEEV